jgi:hypothetical protein
MLLNAQLSVGREVQTDVDPLRREEAEEVKARFGGEMRSPKGED